MGYDDRDAPEPPGTGAVTLLNRITGLLVRLAGLGLLLVGLWAGIAVVQEAWGLYRQPESIERFTQAVERGSHIDDILSAPAAPAAEGAVQQPPPGSSSAPLGTFEQAPADPAGGQQLRLSYFVAWVIVLSLLLIIARIAVWLIRTGGELALYDTRMRRFARTLLESGRRSHAA